MKVSTRLVQSAAYAVSVLILSLSASFLPGAAWNGIDVEEIAQMSTTAKALQSGLMEGDVLLLPSGLGQIARDFVGSGTTLAEYFDAQGMTFLGAVGPDACLVAVNSAAAISKSAFSARLYTLPASARLSEPLRVTDPAAGKLAVHLIVESTTARYLPSWLSTALPAATIKDIAARRTTMRVGLEVQGGDLPMVLQQLSERSDVMSVSLGGGARLLNNHARRIVQSGSNEGGESVWQRGIRGEGQIIGILDTGADPLNCYLAEADGSLPPVVRGAAGTGADPSRRKIIAYDMLFDQDDPANGASAFDSQGHGTAVSGNATGSKVTAGDEFSTSDLILNGVAPAAQLVIQDGGYQVDQCSDLPALGCPVIDLTAILEQVYAQGARIQNNSWGDREDFDPQNTYTAACVDMDDMIWRHPDLLICCAAGNSGVTRGNDGNMPGNVGSPSTAKNVLSLAATIRIDPDSITSFSSDGWSEDLRVKPDLATPGQTYTSARNLSATAIHCTATYIQGTSMASPVAAGSVALVRQYFTEGWYPGGTPAAADRMISPSAALLKAVLINGADQVATEAPSPSPRQGWGRVDLESSLYFAGEDKHLIVVDETATFDNSSDPDYTVHFEAGDGEGAGDLRITLVYTDYPALSGANPALVNNLDLIVEAPGGGSYLGNHFAEFSSRSEAGGSPDARNNVEVVRLAPAAGSYTVRVRPSTILEPGQGFALAVSGDIAPRRSTWWIH